MTQVPTGWRSVFLSGLCYPKCIKNWAKWSWKPLCESLKCPQTVCQGAVCSFQCIRTYAMWRCKLEACGKLDHFRELVSWGWLLAILVWSDVGRLCMKGLKCRQTDQCASVVRAIPSAFTVVQSEVGNLRVEIWSAHIPDSQRVWVVRALPSISAWSEAQSWKPAATWSTPCALCLLLLRYKCGQLQCRWIAVMYHISWSYWVCS